MYACNNLASKYIKQKLIVAKWNGQIYNHWEIADSMDGTGEHYAKWNKPGGEREIPCDLTCM